ncbi:MAG: hypothetical protein E7421_07885 [Ruminococcaceae bacterium]|nr:hypothetical protein [Oscillospiraceae bacterium]
MKKRCLIGLLLCALLLSACSKQPSADTPPSTTQTTTPSTQPSCSHTFGQWTVQVPITDDCKQDGQEARVCTSCGETETRILIPDHNYDEYNVCQDCLYVKYDAEAAVAELGPISYQWYVEGDIANTNWDVKVFNGKVYRGAGDYNEDSGITPIYAYDIATGRWQETGFADDEAIQHFREINGTLYAPGLDPRESWEMGNFYILQEDGSWKKMRTLPNGIHNFDLIEFDGKLFAGLGTDYQYNTTAYSTDGGETFQYAPMYKDGKLFEDSAYEYTRNYEFMVYKGQLYSLMRFVKNVGSDYGFFRYEDGKMIYVGDASAYAGGRAYNRGFFSGKFEFNGRYYVTAGDLFAITDFSGETDGKKIAMPGDEGVVDALLQDGVMYVLATAPAGDQGHKIVIYKSATGEEGSFEEVLSFHYPVLPCAFDMDGTDFYLGMNMDNDHDAQSGMLLRARATN